MQQKSYLVIGAIAVLVVLAALLFAVRQYAGQQNLGLQSQAKSQTKPKTTPQPIRPLYRQGACPKGYEEVVVENGYGGYVTLCGRAGSGFQD